jgi:hypothetical protein
MGAVYEGQYTLPGNCLAGGTGQPFSISVSAVSQLPLGYQWRRNALAITNGTNSTYSVAAAQQSNAGNYDVVITNISGSVTSALAIVAVTNLAILSPPASVLAPYTGTASFSVAAVGALPLSYQWRKSGAPINNATNTIFSLALLGTKDAATYDVIVSNSFGTLTSAPATLTLGGPQLVLTPVSDGTPGASGYAYAGSSAINAVAFICSGLMTVSRTRPWPPRRRMWPPKPRDRALSRQLWQKRSDRCLHVAVFR